MTFRILNIEFTCRVIKHKKKGGYSSKTWAASEVNTALRLQGEGMSYSEIGKELNRTTAAIQCKLHKVRTKDV